MGELAKSYKPAKLPIFNRERGRHSSLALDLIVLSPAYAVEPAWPTFTSYFFFNGNNLVFPVDYRSGDSLK